MSKAELISALIESAIDNFSRHGYEGASLRAIAAQAGAQLSSINLYFGSKAELYAAVHHQVWVEVNRERLGLLEAVAADTALLLVKLGYRTFGAARRVERMANLAEAGVGIIALDVTDEQSIAACVAAIEREAGGIDVLINNAGYGSYGSVEEVPIAEGRHQLEVNLFGLASLTQKIIPHMRKQRWGKIVNISSVGGVAATPYSGWYAASKFAVEGFSSALRQELSPFGVDVIIVRPGATESEWAAHATDSLLEVSGEGPYRNAARALAKALDDTFVNPRMTAPAALLANTIAKAISSRSPRPVYVAPAIAQALPLLSWLLPKRAMDAVFRRMMRLPAHL